MLALGARGCVPHQRDEVGIGRIRDRLAYEFLSIEVKASLVYVRRSVLELNGGGDYWEGEIL